MAIGAGTGAFVLSSAVGALAVPTPNRGPDTGGTTVAVEAPEGRTFTSISAGRTHSLAIGSDGKTYAWGENGAGQLGDGSWVNQNYPVEVAMPDGVTFTEVYAGHSFSLAYGDDGEAYAWGTNTSGQLGDGTFDSRPIPRPVAVPTGVSFTSVTAGPQHALALGDDGKAYAWGENGYGQLGDGSRTNRNAPVEVLMPAGVSFTSFSSGIGHSLGLGDDGKVYAWGQNNLGQIGTGSGGSGFPTPVPSPVEVSTPSGLSFTKVRAAVNRSFAFANDGTVYGWGENSVGQLGNGETNNKQFLPIEVTTPMGVTFVELSGGITHTLALGSDGKTYAFGANNVGQLGDGSYIDRLVPVEVAVPSGISFTSVSAGNYFSLAIGDNGKSYGWGLNFYQQLGSESAISEEFPVAVITDSVELTGITFDGIEGTTPGDEESTVPVDNEDGSWSIVTPAHPSGTVDVVVAWTLNGVAQSPITHPGGFTYYSLAAPTITDPGDQTVTESDPASFAVTAAGEPIPTVSWEASVDGGTTWVPTAQGVSGDGLILTVAATILADSGTKYRATATNSEGSITSAPATLTVVPVPAAPAISDPSDQTVAAGEWAEFSVTAAGVPEPTVEWEVSLDGGSTWEAVTADESTQLLVGGWSLSIWGSANNDGFLYRATAINSEGEATSAAARLTVTAAVDAGDGDGDSDVKDDEVTKELAVTGLSSTPLFWIAGLSALVLGGCLIARNRMVRGRMSS